MSFASLNLKVDAVGRALESMRQPTPTPTPATVASLALQHFLGERKNEFLADATKLSFFTPEEQKVLDECKTEGDVVALVKNKLDLIFKDYIVVNSEKYPWLETQGAKLKPDLFIVPHVGCYEKRGSESGVRNGVLADWRLRDDVFAVEAKQESIRPGLGQAIIYNQHMTPFAKRGFVITKSSFACFESAGVALTRYGEGKWVDGGSADFVKNFFKFEQGWANVPQMCVKLGVRLADPLIDTTSTAFLGAGAFGRVFAVVREAEPTSASKDDVTFEALKVVLKEEAVGLIRQVGALAKHHGECKDCDILVRPTSGVQQVDGLFGYTMTPVGSSLARSNITTEAHIAEVFGHLFKLHDEHGLYHGDARLANIIRLPSGKLMWIDLRDAIPLDKTNREALCQIERLAWRQAPA